MSNIFHYLRTDKPVVIVLALVATLGIGIELGMSIMRQRPPQDGTQVADSLRESQCAAGANRQRYVARGTEGKASRPRYANRLTQPHDSYSHTPDTSYIRKYPSANKYPSDSKPTPTTLLDINVADSVAFVRIPGLGAKSASAILRLRDRLGGFVTPQQILDIKFVNPDIIAWLTVSANPPIRKIDLNKATFKEINRHPYITYEQTADIMNYRRLYGDITSVEALRQTQIFTEEQLEHLKPYLLLE